MFTNELCNVIHIFTNSHYIMASRYSCVVDMDDAEESDVVVHCEAYTAMYQRENRFDLLLFSKKKAF